MRAEMANQYLARQDFIRKPHKYDANKFTGSGKFKQQDLNKDLEPVELANQSHVFRGSMGANRARQHPLQSSVKTAQPVIQKGSINPYSPNSTQGRGHSIKSLPPQAVELNSEVKSIQANVDNCLSDL